MGEKSLTTNVLRTALRLSVDALRIQHGRTPVYQVGKTFKPSLLLPSSTNINSDVNSDNHQAHWRQPVQIKKPYCCAVCGHTPGDGGPHSLKSFRNMGKRQGGQRNWKCRVCKDYFLMPDQVKEEKEEEEDEDEEGSSNTGGEEEQNQHHNVSSPKLAAMAAAAGFTVIDPSECELQGDDGDGGLQWRRLYDAEDGVVGICTQAEGYDHPMHWHAASELIFSLAGRAITLVGDAGGDGDGDGAWARVEAGQCIVPGAMVAHRTKAEQGGYTCLYVFPDGPQDDRRYFHPVDPAVPAHTPAPAPAPAPAAPAAASFPHVSAITLSNIDYESGWHQLVDTPEWSAAILVIEEGAEPVSARQHETCYVLHGTVRCDDGSGSIGGGSTSSMAKSSHLERVGAGVRAHWSCTAEGNGPACVLLCMHKLSSIVL